MEHYLRERQKSEKHGTITGVALTVLVHVSLIPLLSSTGLKYLDPPPQEESFVLEVQPEEMPQEKEVVILPKQRGKQPQSETVDLTAPIERVKKSESPHVSKVENMTPETKENGHGDVEVPAPERKEEPKLDPRATFPGMSRKDTTITAPHSAKEASATFASGQPDGNIKEGKTEGTANAHVKGRNVLGGLPRPSYSVQESGTVVVKITVDQYGKVVTAIPGAQGTTVSSKDLWNEARKAAMKAKFNMDADAPAETEGTITYKFNLK